MSGYYRVVKDNFSRSCSVMCSALNVDSGKQDASFTVEIVGIFSVLLNATQSRPVKIKVKKCTWGNGNRLVNLHVIP